jgi:glycosyltransferase involved in cell wall biosynthesis
VPQASVIIPARNAAATLPRTLEALAGQDVVTEFEVIVVDDGSEDETTAVAEGAGLPVRLLVQPPRGPAAARNHGARAALAPVLAFCDADVFPEAGWLRAGLAAVEQADLVQGKVLPEPGAELGPFDRSLWVTGQRLLWETANLFVTREVFDRVGGFEEWLAPRYGGAMAEDIWFAHRALRSGARGSFCEQALAYHAVIPRRWAAYVAERHRLIYFPAIAAKMPEVRREFLYRRLFLNRRTARLDLGLGGTLAALVLRSPLPLLALLPYISVLLSHSARARRDGRASAGPAAADLAADLVAFAALAAGSLRYRSPVI